MIHLFYCSNSMTESETRQLGTRFGTDELKMLGLPCSGKITIPYLVKAFESGADGIVLCCCVPAECRNLEGNLRASKRAQAVDSLMEEVGLGKNRVLTVTKGQGDIEQVIQSITRFQTGLRAAPGSSRDTVVRKESTSGARTRRENAA
jgi:coenzyme F420-reducing hydrogenase delta subunit